MRNKLKFYLNLALLGFTVGQTYMAFQQRVARSRSQAGTRQAGTRQIGRRQRWN